MRTRLLCVSGVVVLVLLSLLALVRTGGRRWARPPGESAGRVAADPPARESGGGPATGAPAYRGWQVAAGDPDFPEGTTSAERPRQGPGALAVERHARVLFGRLDRDGDGLLDDDEMTPTLRAERPRWDANRDGVIDREEFRSYFQDRVERFRSAAGADLPQDPDQPTPSRMSWSGAARRAGGPAGIPAWFRELDTDNDGQVGLDEWTAAGRPAEEFRRLDHDRDGFLTPKEVLSALPPTVTAPGTYVTAWADQTEQPDVPGRPSALAPERGGENNGRAGASGLVTGGILVAGAPPRTPAPRVMAQRLEAQHVAAAAAASRPPAANGAGAGSPKPAPAPAATPAPAPAPAPAVPASPDSWATVALPLDVSSNPVWVERNQQNEQRLLQGGHANVLFLGDSITDWLATGAGQPLWDTYLEPLDAEDLAIGGLTTSQVLWQVETGQVALAAPDVVVLLIGSNNLGLLGQSPEAVAAGITRIVEEIGAELPDTRILLLGILPRGQTPDDPLRAQLAEVNRLIAGLDDGDQVRFLDIGASFLQPDGQISPDVMPDFAHPSLKGYQLYIDAVMPPLVGMLLQE